MPIVYLSTRLGTYPAARPPEASDPPTDIFTHDLGTYLSTVL